MPDTPVAGSPIVAIPPGKPNPHLAISRVDRQHRLIEALEAMSPRPLSADRLADLLEVSTRTVERDIAQLVAAGIQVTIKRGPGGGFAMAGPRKPPPVQLDRGEIAVLITALVALGDYASATARSALSTLTAGFHPPETPHD
jgi:predicted DNA-binding transcriptional regulator YafY